MRRSVLIGLRSKWAWSLRRRLRSPLLFWLAAATVGVLTTSTVSRIIDDAEAQQRRYGEWTWTIVAARDLPGGTLLEPEDVRLTRLPRVMVPESAWRQVPDRVRLRQPVTRGEVVLRDRTSGRASPITAQLGPNDRAIGVPLAAPSLTLRGGDRVDVLALSSDAGGYAVVVENATVISRIDELATLSVTADDVGAVAAAVASGTAQLAVRAP